MGEAIIIVDTDTVACDGSDIIDNIIPGHPKVYLTFKSNTITCPYCSKVFERRTMPNDKAAPASKVSKKK